MAPLLTPVTPRPTLSLQPVTEPGEDGDTFASVKRIYSDFEAVRLAYATFGALKNA